MVKDKNLIKTHIFLFQSPREKQQTDCLGKQCTLAQFLTKLFWNEPRKQNLDTS